MKKFIAIGKKIYNMDNSSERRRLVIFLGRVFFNKSRMNRVLDFFKENPAREKLAEINPFFYEQVTRQFFYRGSTFNERAKLIEEHVDYVLHSFDNAVIDRIYSGEKITLWEEEYQERTLRFVLNFEAGQRKEGTLAIMLDWGNDHLYQIMFWIASDHTGKPAVWIGAMQGPNMENSPEIIKALTKRCFAYRTKNLILHAVRIFAEAMEIEKIYAVANDGYYANNHVRADRKLKTDLDSFWKETGGEEYLDKRFYTIPVHEYRKTIEEVKSQKRNLYRKRYAFLDEVEASIKNVVEKIKA